MSFVEISDGFDVAVGDDCEEVKRLFLAVPFVVGEENEVTIFVDDLVYFLFVIENVVDPTQRELFFLQMRQRDLLVNLRRLFNQVQVLDSELQDVFFSCRVDDGDLQVYTNNAIS